MSGQSKAIENWVSAVVESRTTRLRMKGQGCRLLSPAVEGEPAESGLQVG